MINRKTFRGILALSVSALLLSGCFAEKSETDALRQEVQKLTQQVEALEKRKVKVIADYLQVVGQEVKLMRGKITTLESKHAAKPKLQRKLPKKKKGRKKRSRKKR